MTVHTYDWADVKVTINGVPIPNGISYKGKKMTDQKDFTIAKLNRRIGDLESDLALMAERRTQLADLLGAAGTTLDRADADARDARERTQDKLDAWQAAADGLNETVKRQADEIRALRDSLIAVRADRDRLIDAERARDAAAAERKAKRAKARRR